MKQALKKLVNGYLPFLRRLYFFGADKRKAEIDFWKNEIGNYQRWYLGELDCLYGEKSPAKSQKVEGHSLKDNSLLTWFNVHQKTKYLEDLNLDESVFRGMKVLDVGSGPFASALCFKDAQIFCLDPLLPEYIRAGFPIHYYEGAKFVYGFSEEMPFEDNFFDAVISVNAIDHIDDFSKTADEIRRVLKPGGKLRMHAHYHPKTAAEPIELNDEIMEKTFGWLDGFKKISESRHKRGYDLEGRKEKYTLWSN